MREWDIISKSVYKIKEQKVPLKKWNEMNHRTILKSTNDSFFPSEEWTSMCKTSLPPKIYIYIE